MSLETMWTGWLSIELRNGPAVTNVDVNVRYELVLFYLGDRNIAVIDRERFRGWLVHPHHELRHDDIVLLQLLGEACISIDASTPYVLPKDAVQELVRLV
ncbi:hypothetical protein [Kineosporia succinea]|uniref:Uncharacterized protein n=1 Tax=Kineosporia succinea TaxID=84632 RepID=A0ABT9P5C8_9ACTN|nr:hypothetical protein [Kineosporia succinea]MDP9827899.1 hypothetical protein [Kineosporia succinea]